MASDRGASPTFWQVITNVANTELLTFENLYQAGINKVHDSARWGADEITKLRSQLAAQTTGTAASLTGSVDLTTLIYGAGGTLDGLAFTVQANAGGAQVITFGTGVSAPTSPADVIAQIDADVDANVTAVLNQNGTLTIGSATLGVGSTFQITSSASAAQLLGFGNTYPAIAPTGTGAVSDGSTKIGVAPYGTAWAGGTLRAALEQILSATFAQDVTINGRFTFSGRHVDARPEVALAADTSVTIGPAQGGAFRIACPTVAEVTLDLRTSTLPLPTDGEEMVITVDAGAGGGAVSLRREGELGANRVATLVASATHLAHARVRFVNGVWRLFSPLTTQVAPGAHS